MHAMTAKRQPKTQPSARAGCSKSIPSSPDLAHTPASPFERGAADADITRGRALEAIGDDEPDSAIGAADASSGGGAAAGIAGGSTDMRTDRAFDRSDVQKDREKLFPESSGPNPGKPRGGQSAEQRRH